MSLQHEWQIPRGAHRCTVCTHEFEPGEHYVARIYDVKEGLVRSDYCAGCAEQSAPDFIGTWRARRPELSARKHATLDRAALLQFFQHLTPGPEETEKLQFRFVLALLLWRQKVVRLVDTVNDESGAETWQFVEPHANESYSVIRPPLADEEIERLSTQLERLIGGDPSTDESPASAATATVVAAHGTEVLIPEETRV
ncbi:MAG: hypothetical protein SF069_00580 [Phycisphaerae bacterium]|nr:hypothetical protein [Phycisphaerae bacterium]